MPLYLSCAAIIEEGLPFDVLERLVRSMATAARQAGVDIVTGDTKVVERGACDKLFLTTTGIGVIRSGVVLGAQYARPGDAVLVNGVLGDHGAAILAARGDLALDAPIDSDCAALHGLVEIELRPIVEGTELIFIHSRLHDEDTRRSHEEGWNGALDKLERHFLIERRSP